MDISTYAGDVLLLKQMEDDLNGHIEKLVRSYEIPRLKAQLAKQKVSSAIQIIIGNQTPELTKKLTFKADSDLRELIKETGKGRRVILLMTKEDNSGVIELLSKKEFDFE